MILNFHDIVFQKKTNKGFLLKTEENSIFLPKDINNFDELLFDLIEKLALLTKKEV